MEYLFLRRKRTTATSERQKTLLFKAAERQWKEEFAGKGTDIRKVDCNIYKGEFYQFNLSSCIRQQNSLTAQFVSFSLSNLANIFYPPPNFYNN